MAWFSANRLLFISAALVPRGAARRSILRISCSVDLRVGILGPVLFLVCLFGGRVRFILAIKNPFFVDPHFCGGLVDKKVCERFF